MTHSVAAQETIPLRPSSPPDALTIRFVIVLMLAAVVPSIASGQAKPATAPAPEVKITSTPAKTQKLSDLTARYRFFERYTNDDEHTAPGMAASSRIAIIEVVKESIENAKGAPKRTETTRHAIFTERPLEVNTLGVNSIVRTYERYKVKTAETSGTKSQPLEGLSILIRPKLADLPQILSLNDGRSLTETEYDAASHQMFLAQISTLLPGQVVRIGDTWKLTRKAAQGLLADPLIVGDGLVAKLAEIRKEVDGPRFVASIEITGKLLTPAGESAVKAELLFTFVGESSLKLFSNKPTFPPRPSEDITESRGSITEIRMARMTSGPLPGPGRLRYQLNRELTMHRQVGLVEGSVPPPKLKQIPEPTEANSWLTFVDPSYKYSFRHPQDLLIPERSLATPEPKISFMTRSNREGRDILQIELASTILTPEDLKKELAEKYKQMKMEVIKGGEVWLPEKEWPATMKVHRIDAEVKLADTKSVSVGSARIHFDGYLILTGQTSSLIAIASTTNSGVAPYRKEVEKILRSLRLDPPRPPSN
jgi:hypothetical protein